MRPSFYHNHQSVKTYFGDDDVHGKLPRPRAHEFDDAPGIPLVAFTDTNVEASLEDASSIYREDFGTFAC